MELLEARDAAQNRPFSGDGWLRIALWVHANIGWMLQKPAPFNLVRNSVVHSPSSVIGDTRQLKVRERINCSSCSFWLSMRHYTLRKHYLIKITATTTAVYRTLHINLQVTK